MTGEPPPLSFDNDDDLFAVPPATKPPATRTGDPETSFKAAARAEAQQNTVRYHVHKFAKEAGPGGFIDDELLAAFPDAVESTYRTRRSELTHDGLIMDSGKQRQNQRGNPEVVWVHRDHMPGVPCPTRLPPEEWAALKARAQASAKDMDAAATQALAEGAIHLGRFCKEAATLLRQLSA